jgi:hypothetical protein
VVGSVSGPFFPILKRSTADSSSVVAKVFMAWSGAMHKVKATVQNLVNQRVREKTMTLKHEQREDHVCECHLTPEIKVLTT